MHWERGGCSSRRLLVTTRRILVRSIAGAFQKNTANPNDQSPAREVLTQPARLRCDIQVDRQFVERAVNICIRRVGPRINPGLYILHQLPAHILRAEPAQQPGMIRKLHAIRLYATRSGILQHRVRCPSKP